MLKSHRPSDTGVDKFESIRRADVPDYIPWLHRQAKFGYANKTTKTQAGFKIGAEDIKLMPDLDGILGVVLGYERT